MTSRLTGAVTVRFVAIAAILITSSPVHGQQNTVIQACVNKSSGEVKIVSRPAQCNVNEQLLTWQTAAATAAGAAELAALTERVAKLEGQITAADLVGTYAIIVLENDLVGLIPGVRNANIKNQAFTGTVTLNADGTGSSNVTGTGNVLTLGTGALTQIPGGGSGNFHWTYANGTITTDATSDFGNNISFTVGLNTRLAVGVLTDFDSVNKKSDVTLFILTRLQ